MPARKKEGIKPSPTMAEAMIKTSIINMITTNHLNVHPRRIQ